MNAGSLEGALRLQKFIFLAVMALAVVIFGYTLADDAFFAALTFGGLAWLMLMQLVCADTDDPVDAVGA